MLGSLSPDIRMSFLFRVHRTCGVSLFFASENVLSHQLSVDTPIGSRITLSNVVWCVVRSSIIFHFQFSINRSAWDLRLPAKYAPKIITTNFNVIECFTIHFTLSVHLILCTRLTRSIRLWQMNYVDVSSFIECAHRCCCIHLTAKCGLWSRISRILLPCALRSVFVQSAVRATTSE